MMISGAVLLLLLISAITPKSTGVVVTDCGACHEDATCSSSQGANEEIVTCSCKAGFVGNGVDCYNRAACDSDGLCCHSGYQWSSERGCVDVDECSSSEENPAVGCTSPLVCENIPGSYDCQYEENNSNSSSDNRSKRSVHPSSNQNSVLFSCGGVACPAGQDCLTVNGNEQCLDPCQDYSRLDDAWRATDFRNGSLRYVNTAVCGTCREDETCVSEDKVNWRCERWGYAQFGEGSGWIWLDAVGAQAVLLSHNAHTLGLGHMTVITMKMLVWFAQ
ncbi:hypothetical protein AAFF_G00191590, partial [Aldrovandia affinis]